MEQVLHGSKEIPDRYLFAITTSRDGTNYQSVFRGIRAATEPNLRSTDFIIQMLDT